MAVVKLLLLDFQQAPHHQCEPIAYSQSRAATVPVSRGEKGRGTGEGPKELAWEVGGEVEVCLGSGAGRKRGLFCEGSN